MRKQLRVDIYGGDTFGGLDAGEKFVHHADNSSLGRDKTRKQTVVSDIDEREEGTGLPAKMGHIDNQSNLKKNPSHSMMSTAPHNDDFYMFYLF